METTEISKVCGVERAGALDLSIRKWIQDPQKILKPYIKPGMTILDVGCGPGYFTLEMAKMLGGTGKVIAADLQDGMLEIVKKKVSNTMLQEIVELHKCQSDKIGLAITCDFILVFYMLHEVPNQLTFLQELHTLLKPGGNVLVVEPKFHVTKKDFASAVEIIKNTGFKVVEEPTIFFSRSVLLRKA